MKVYTLTHIADWEGGVTVYGSHLDLWNAIQAEAERVAADSGKWLPIDPKDWPGFVEEHGWKVQHFVWEEHDLETSPRRDYLRFRMEPRAHVVCGNCKVPIRNDGDDLPDEWRDETGSFRCNKGDRPDHKPGLVSK